MPLLGILIVHALIRLIVGDRFVTSWIRLMGKGAPEVPYVHVLLTGRGPALVAVKAEVLENIFTLRQQSRKLPMP